MRSRQLTLVALSVALALAACAPAGSSQPASPGGAVPQQPAARKTMVAALLKPNLPSIMENGADRIHELALAGLGRLDVWNVVHPQLAEAVPTIENGGWKVFPDGTMETAWKLRPDARWHDGTPITSADYVFGTTVAQDRELGTTINANYASIDSIQAPDPRTVVVKWKKTYIDADVFSGGLLQMLPRHLLEGAYAGNKAVFYSQPYWSSGLIHAGPYQVREWYPDSHVILEAYNGYVLGRAKIDQIEVKFIPDANTMVANLLAGAVHMTLGQSMSPEQADDLKTTWRDGAPVTSPVFGSSVGILIQFMDPSPALLADVRFRRALIHAFDRQALIDTVLRGQVPVAHAIVGGLPQGIDNAAAKYDYDVRRASQLMEELGYRKGGDGVYQDAGGRPLGMEVRGVQEEEIRVKTTLTSEADWRAFGINTNLVMVPATFRDDMYLATWPGTFTRGIAGGITAGLFNYFHTSRIRTAETNWLGGNTPRYRSAELDRLIDGVISTIPRTERTRLIEQAVRHMTENAITIGGFYVPYNAAVNSRMVNVTTSSTFAQAWDAHVWDVK